MAITTNEDAKSDGRRYFVKAEGKTVGELVHESGDFWTLDLRQHGRFESVVGFAGPPLASAIGYTAVALGRDL